MGLAIGCICCCSCAFVATSYAKSRIDSAAVIEVLSSTYPFLSETDKIILKGMADFETEEEIAKKVIVSVEKLNEMTDDLLKRISLKNRQELMRKLERI